MPVIGAGSYSPGGRFAFPRSYIRGVAVQIVAGVINRVANVWTLQNPPDPTLYTFVLDARFYQWNSNRWTLDYMVYESYYQPGGVGALVPMPFLLTYYINPANKSPYVIFSPFSSPGGLTYFDLPTAPGGYWLPRWPT